MSENARALALINMAISDSLVATFLNKYHYNFWRPETAIHAGDTRTATEKTEADQKLAIPFIVTPCFPSYPSNHDSAANAAAAVMKRLYGEAGHSMTLSNPAVPTIVLQYSSFKQITDDISDARVYGGIQNLSNRSGNAGALLSRPSCLRQRSPYKHNLRPVHDDDWDDNRDDD